MGTRLDGGATPYGPGPVSANTVVPWPVQPKPEPKVPATPKETGGERLSEGPFHPGAPVRERSERGGGRQLGGSAGSNDSGHLGFTAPKDEVELARSAGFGHREKVASFLDRAERRTAPRVGQEPSGVVSADAELSEQLRSNLNRSRLELSQRRGFR